MMMGIVVWAQEAVFNHIYLLMLMLGQVCSWVELPVQRRLCPIFVREVGSPDLHECFRGLTTDPRDLGRHRVDQFPAPPELVIGLARSGYGGPGRSVSRPTRTCKLTS